MINWLRAAWYLLFSIRGLRILVADDLEADWDYADLYGPGITNGDQLMIDPNPVVMKEVTAGTFAGGMPSAIKQREVAA